MKKEAISIIGFGRFGKTLYRFLKEDFVITIYDIDSRMLSGIRLTKGTIRAKSLAEVYSNPVIIYAIPISLFEKTLLEHKTYIDNHLLMDVLSVKTHPANVFTRILRNTKARYILTHPMFGPDSSKDGFDNLPMVIHTGSASEKEYTFWKKYFKKKKLRLIEITPQQHDKLAAYSQGLTHFIGRLLEKVHFERTPLDTRGAEMLHKVREQVENDTWELFLNLQIYNPYTKHMRRSLGDAYNMLYNQLLPDRTRAGVISIGIQGGAGSFNEEALQSYIRTHELESVHVVYLYTTEKVLNALSDGIIDYGLFAMHNSVGGIVQESVRALAEHRVSIIEEFTIPVRHVLMKRRDVTDINGIVAHPQVFKQCKETLRKKYAHLILESGSGDMIDTAKAADALRKGRLSKNKAILGPKALSRLYDLEIIAENIQDDKKNETSFLIVRRP